MKFKSALTALALGKELVPDFEETAVLFADNGIVKLRVDDKVQDLPTDIESLLVMMECDWYVR